jgi:hypothetical protein
LSNGDLKCMTFTHTKKLILGQLVRQGSGFDEKGPDPTGHGSATLAGTIQATQCNINIAHKQSTQCVRSAKHELASSVEVY